MKVPKLKNIQLEAAKTRQKRLPIAIKNTEKLSRAYKDLELGYELEYDHETRSNAELQQDRLYIERQLRPKLKTLFGKDGAEIDAYVNYLQQNQVSLSDFNTIFPELQKMGSKLTANVVIARSSKLLQNLSDNGTTSMPSISQMKKAFEESKNLIQEEYDNDNLEKSDANDYTHKLNALKKILTTNNPQISSEFMKNPQNQRELQNIGESITTLIFTDQYKEDTDILVSKLLQILDGVRSYAFTQFFEGTVSTPTVTPLESKKAKSKTTKTTSKKDITQRKLEFTREVK